MTPQPGGAVPDKNEPLLIKRYASRRLYNTETSDYVTLDDIAGFIRAGRDVKIIDLKSGDDLTRQYLLQIISEHEGRGENMLPVTVLTDLVRSYASGMQSVVPQVLAMSFEMLREGQAKMVESMAGGIASPLAGFPGLEALQAQQQAFLRAMSGGTGGGTGERPPPGTGKAGSAGQGGAPGPGEAEAERRELEEIRRQLAELQERLSRL